LRVVDAATSTLVCLAARKTRRSRCPQSAAYLLVCDLPASLACLVCEPPDANELMAATTSGALPPERRAPRLRLRIPGRRRSAPSGRRSAPEAPAASRAPPA